MPSTTSNFLDNLIKTLNQDQRLFDQHIRHYSNVIGRFFFSTEIQAYQHFFTQISQSRKNLIALLGPSIDKDDVSKLLDTVVHNLNNMQCSLNPRLAAYIKKEAAKYIILQNELSSMADNKLPPPNDNLFSGDERALVVQKILFPEYPHPTQSRRP